jgi:predicted transcriptional regulator of viral defense system
MTSPAHSDPLGIQLLRRLTEDGSTQVVTTAEALHAAQDLGISTRHAYKLLSQLSHSGWLQRLKYGLYVPQLPGGPPSAHPFAIATRLAEPAAISHWSALHHWGLVDQVPFSVTASTPRSIVPPSARHSARSDESASKRHAAWVIDGARYEFIRIPARDLFGIEQVWVDASTAIPIFDRERSVLDAFVHLKGFGVGGLGDELVATHTDALDPERLLGYAEEMGRPLVLARVRRALDAAEKRTTSDPGPA